MSSQSLKVRTAKGMVWNATEKFAVQAVSFVIGTILARMLTPSDYGLIGMLAIFLSLSELFVGSAFSTALIQKKNRTEIDFSTIFYYNFFVAIIFYIILFFTAPFIADFYNAPQLILLTRLLSLNIIINSLSLVQQTRLTIKLDFKTQALVTLFSVAISGILGIVAAYHNYGVWALVIQSISNATLRMVVLFLINKWFPLFVFDFNSFRELFGFSSKLLGAYLIATIYNNIYSVFIGKMFKAQDLGYYTRARLYPEYFSNASTSVLQGVSFPVLSSLQDDRERMVLAFSRLMGMVVFSIFPTLTLFAILSEPFVRFFLTEKWLPIVPLMQWICFARMITPISTLNLNMLTSVGRSDLFLKVDLSKIPLLTLAIVFTIPLGLKAVVIGHFLIAFISFFINAYYPGKLYNYGVKRQIKAMSNVILATILMALGVSFILTLFSSNLLKLCVGVSFGIILFLSFAYILKIKELDEVKSFAVAIYDGIINKIKKIR